MTPTEVLCPKCGSNKVTSGRQGEVDVTIVPLHCCDCGHNCHKDYPVTSEDWITQIDEWMKLYDKPSPTLILYDDMIRILGKRTKIECINPYWRLKNE